jgi:hypothetical protein
MSAKARTRFWIELALAVGSALLVALTLVSREWIEVIFGVDPDGGSGALEWAVVGTLLLASLTFSILARADWKRICLPEPESARRLS